VSCYTRHLGDLLPPDPTWLDRRALDEAVRAELGVVEADCPEVWEAVKANRNHLVQALRRGVVRGGKSGPSEAGHERGRR